MNSLNTDLQLQLAEYFLKNNNVYLLSLLKTNTNIFSVVVYILRKYRSVIDVSNLNVLNDNDILVAVKSGEFAKIVVNDIIKQRLDIDLTDKNITIDDISNTLVFLMDIEDVSDYYIEYVYKLMYQHNINTNNFINDIVDNIIDKIISIFRKIQTFCKYSDYGIKLVRDYVMYLHYTDDMQNINKLFNKYLCRYDECKIIIDFDDYYDNLLIAIKSKNLTATKSFFEFANHYVFAELEKNKIKRAALISGDQQIIDFVNSRLI